MAGTRRDRLSVVLVGHLNTEMEPGSDTGQGRPVDLTVCPDRAEALLILGRVRPDAVVLDAGLASPLGVSEFVRVLRRRDTAAAHLWVDGQRLELTANISRLRRRLGDDPANPQWIKAIPRGGYQFAVPPQPPEPFTDGSQP